MSTLKIELNFNGDFMMTLSECNSTRTVDMART